MMHPYTKQWEASHLSLISDAIVVTATKKDIQVRFTHASCLADILFEYINPY